MKIKNLRQSKSKYCLYVQSHASCGLTGFKTSTGIFLILLFILRGVGGNCIDFDKLCKAIACTTIPFNGS